MAGIGHGDHQRGVVRFQRHEFIAEHQFGWDAAEKVGINTLLAQIHERAAIALRQPTRLIALGSLVRQLLERSDYSLGVAMEPILTPGTHLEGKQRKIK